MKNFDISLFSNQHIHKLFNIPIRRTSSRKNKIVKKRKFISKITFIFRKYIPRNMYTRTIPSRFLG